MEMKLGEILAGRLGGSDVLYLAAEYGAEKVFPYLSDADKRTADNAAWVLTHCPSDDDGWLTAHQDELIDLALRTESITMRRLTMTVLLRTPFESDDVRTDFLDFCLDMMMRPDQPNGVRSVAMKLAYLQCRPFPELLDELRQTLDIMETEFLSPALRTTKKNLLKETRMQ